MCIRQNSVSFSLAMTAICAMQVNSALACMMLPRDFDGRISQRRHQAILIHHGNREELILRVNYKITGDKTPSHFAWIITTPSEPSAYHLADEKVFRDTGRWATKLLRPTPPPPAQANRGAAQAVDALREPTLEFGKREVIGPYDIQPVRARGSNALQALNEWLAKNGFPKEDPGHMKYFIDQEFTFLCVKINPAAGVDGVASTGVLPPLHLSFESERPYYPLLFSSRQGVFDVELTTLTDDSLDYGGSYHALTNQLRWANSRYKKNVPVRIDELPTTLAKGLGKGQTERQPVNWRLNVIQGKSVNSGRYVISGWKSDVFLAKRAARPDRLGLLLPMAVLLTAAGSLAVWRRGAIERTSTHPDSTP
ncbi:MAG: DUF2330 domain-containing protein [Pirellulaceae bacterium]